MTTTLPDSETETADLVSGGLIPRRTVGTATVLSAATFPSLHLARSSRWARRLAAVLLVLLTVCILLMAFAPWQQTVTGAGFVMAYAPRERQQTLEATIEGRIIRWNEELVENIHVRKGEFIAEIRDLDAEYATRLNAQLDNTTLMLQASKKIVAASQGQLDAYREVQQQVASAQDAYVAAATEKANAAEQKLALAQAAIPQLQAAFERARTLHEQGNLSLEKVQESERKLNESQAKVREEMANASAAKADLLGKQNDRLAYIQKAAADVRYYEGALDKARAEVAKVEKERLELQSKIARQDTQIVTAPFDGYLVEISSNIGTQLVKKGDPICRIVPATCTGATSTEGPRRYSSNTVQPSLVSGSRNASGRMMATPVAGPSTSRTPLRPSRGAMLSRMSSSIEASSSSGCRPPKGCSRRSQLAIAAVVKGYKCIFTTTDKQSKEKVDALKAFGADPKNIANGALVYQAFANGDIDAAEGPG